MLVFKARRRVSPALRQESTPSEKRIASRLVEARREVEKWIERNETAFMDAIARRPWTTVADMIPVDPWYDFQEFLQAELTAEAVDAGFRAVDSPVGKAVEPLLGYRFDATRPEASRWAAREAGNMVSEVTQGQRALIRDVISRGQVEGITVDQTARTIRQSVGLTTEQSGWVDNFYERSLTEGIGSGLSSGRAAARANAATARYHDQIHRYRANTIARTEVARAASEGRQLAWGQGIEQGFISLSAQKEWIAEADACQICSPRNGQRHPVNKPWPGGEPPAHPNCRCDMLLIPDGVAKPKTRRDFASVVSAFVKVFPIGWAKNVGVNIATDKVLNKIWESILEEIDERIRSQFLSERGELLTREGRPERGAIYAARSYQERTGLRSFARTKRDSFSLPINGEDVRVNAVARYKGTDEITKIFDRVGVSTPDIYELDPREAILFHKLLIDAKRNNKYGASVQDYEVSDYAGMRLFITDNGGAGFALKDGDELVSVFRGDTSLKGVADWMVHLGIEQGARRADAFDTVLPHIYGDHGMVVVARTSWNDAFSPPGWDKKTFSAFNNGEPDVVFMVYNPIDYAGYLRGSGMAFDKDSYDTAYEYTKTIQGWLQSRNVYRKSPDPYKDTPNGAPDRPFAYDDVSYRSTHSAPGPDFGATMDDVRGMYPDDFYDGNALRYYGTGDDVADRESLAAVMAVRNDPDGMVTIYRAVPKGVTQINDGDWVTPSLTYARYHGDGPLNGSYDIISIKVPARTVYTNADSIHEWGYYRGTRDIDVAPDKVVPVERNPFDDVMASASDILENAKNSPLRGSPGHDGDPILKQIYKVLGYDALPDVIDSDDFDSLIAGGATPIYRGIYDNELNIGDLLNEFRYGNYYAGKGIYGSGTYTADDHQTALSFANNNPQRGLLRMVLSGNANIIDYDELNKQWIAFTRGDAWEDLPWQVRDVLMDEGRFAAALGYDAIRVGGRERYNVYFVILNRGVVTVDKNNGFGRKTIDSLSLRREHSDFQDSAFYDNLTQDGKEPYRDMYYYAAWRGYDYVLESDGIKDIRRIRDRYMSGKVDA